MRNRKRRGGVGEKQGRGKRGGRWGMMLVGGGRVEVGVGSEGEIGERGRREREESRREGSGGEIGERERGKRKERRRGRRWGESGGR